MKWIADQNNLCLFFELNDEQLARVKQDRKYYRDESFVKGCTREQGRNAHIHLLVINDRTNIREWTRRLLRDYQTVSSWNREHAKFTILGGKNV